MNDDELMTADYTDKRSLYPGTVRMNNAELITELEQHPLDAELLIENPITHKTSIVTDIEYDEELNIVRIIT